MKGFLCSTIGELTVGIKYNEFTDKITIGGNKKFSGEIQSIINDYFDMPFYNLKEKMTAKNKIKYIFKCEVNKVNDAIRRLKEDGVEFKPVKMLERIWW